MESEGHYAQLVLTLGIALILQNGGMILFGSQLMSVRTPFSSTAWELGPFWGDFVSVFVNKGRGIACLFSVGIIAALWLMISSSTLGKALRSAADKPERSEEHTSELQSLM